MDPELRAYLDAMRSEAAVRDAETRQLLRAEIAATRAVTEAALQVASAAQTNAEAAQRNAEAARDAAAALRREARVLHEETWRKIDALAEGLSTHQREEVARLHAAREESLLNEHILPLEASATNREKRIRALEQGRSQ